MERSMTCVLCRSGTCDITEDEVRSTYFTERNEDDALTSHLPPRAALRYASHRLAGHLRPFSGYCFDQCNRFAHGCGNREGTLLLRGKQRGSSPAE